MMSSGGEKWSKIAKIQEKSFVKRKNPTNPSMNIAKVEVSLTMTFVLFLRINLVGFLHRLFRHLVQPVGFRAFEENHEEVSVVDVDRQAEGFLERFVPGDGNV